MRRSTHLVSVITFLGNGGRGGCLSWCDRRYDEFVRRVGGRCAASNFEHFWIEPVALQFWTCEVKKPDELRPVTLKVRSEALYVDVSVLDGVHSSFFGIQSSAVTAEQPKSGKLPRYEILEL
jgi:hypothetical protein